MMIHILKLFLVFDLGTGTCICFKTKPQAIAPIIELEGGMAYVYCATFKGEDVVVKERRGDTSQEDFLKEVQITKILSKQYPEYFPEVRFGNVDRLRLLNIPGGDLHDFITKERNISFFASLKTSKNMNIIFCKLKKPQKT